MDRNRLGVISLGVAVGGFAAMEIAGRLTGCRDHAVWRVIQTGFEAGTVGGLADWFAVTALFREVPIPVLRHHTNIIIKNRDKITDGIVEMVTKRWLTPEIIKEKLSTFSASDAVLKYLDKPENREQVVTVLRDVIRVAASSMDKVAVAKFMETTLRRDLLSLNLGEPLGRWLQSSLKSGDHEPLLDTCALLAEKELKKAERRRDIEEVIVRNVKAAMLRYKDQGVLKRLTIGAAEFIGGLDYVEIAGKVYDTMLEECGVMKRDRQHPIRLELKRVLCVFAAELESGTGNAAAQFRNMQQRFVNRLDLEEVLKKMIVRLQDGLLDDLNRTDGVIVPMLRKMLDSACRTLREDAEMRLKLNEWVRRAVAMLVDQHHGEIGAMVRTSLERLDDNALVRQIEEKVGDDLQYIRLNGAVVGAAAGIVLAVIKLLV